MIVDFRPAQSGELSVSRDVMREAMSSLRPEATDAEFDAAWAGFVAMKQRVENPRRRIGGDVCRKGPVLFDPVQYRP